MGIISKSIICFQKPEVYCLSLCNETVRGYKDWHWETSYFEKKEKVENFFITYYTSHKSKMLFP